MEKHIKFLESLIATIMEAEEKNPGSITSAKDFAALCSSLKDLQLASLIQDIRDGRVKLGGISNIHGDNIVGPG